MLSKNKIKWIHSLAQKKYRNETGCFLAEGNKLVDDILPHFECELLLTHSSWLATQGDVRTKELIVAEDGDIERASLLKNPQDVLAVFRQPVYHLDPGALKTKLSLVLDGIQDPGNLGTIVRLADWFGIDDVICSSDSADIYNPKTLQATMGALARVRTHYTDLPVFLKKLTSGSNSLLPVYGTFLEGDSLYNRKLSSKGLIIMGNEGNGISPEVEAFVTQKIHIPSYPAWSETSESLNVGVATAIVCAEFRRRQVDTV